MLLQLQLLAGRLWTRFSRDAHGSSLVEYVLLVAFIALVCIAAVTYLGSTTTTDLSQVGSQVKG